MSIKITIPNSSSDVLTFGSGNTPTAAQIAGIDSGSSNGQLALYTTASGTSTERVRVDSSGNVGIGTTTPAGKLQINTTSADCDVRVTTTTSGVAAFSVIGYNSSTTIAGSNGGATLTLWNKDTTANTYSAIESLDASGSLTNKISFVNASDANNEGYMVFQTRPSGGAITERMRIDSSGNLLVGTTSVLGGASGKIALYSSDLTATNGATIKNGTANTGGAFIRFVNSSDATIGSISQNASTTVAYNTSSDARLKTSLGVSTDTSVVDTLIIHDFKWKESGLTDKGVFAQEAYEIKPTAVLVGKDDLTDDGNIANPWGVDYSKFVPDLIVHAQQLKKQVQEQQAIITSLTDRITALENK